MQLLDAPPLLARLPRFLPQHLRQLVGVRVQPAREIRDVKPRLDAVRRRYLRTVFLDSPVRRDISRIDASGWEKGQIEKNVQDARHRLWQPAPSFPSLAALNDWLEKRCRELWTQTPHGSRPGMISDVWSEEAQHLMPLPRPFDGFVEFAKRNLVTCLIHLERNRYSVPASFATIARSACGSIPSVSSSLPKGRSSANNGRPSKYRPRPAAPASRAGSWLRATREVQCGPPSSGLLLERRERPTGR